MAVSAVSLERHYAKSATEFCDFNEKFSCDIVNRSEYSTVSGIPVAAIGVAGYAALFLLSTFWKSAIGDSKPPAGRGFSGIGLRALSDLHRSLQIDDVVHFVPYFARPDLPDQRFRHPHKVESARA